MPEPEPEKHFEVWQENWEIVKFFLLCQTQWRVGGMGGVTGLDYASCVAVIKMYETDQVAVFEGLQIMEAAALVILNKEKK